MNSSRWMLRSLCAAAPLVFAGCMAPGPYTYGTYPGYYAPPPGYAPGPGAPIMAPGPSFPSPQLGPAVTPTPAWTPSPSTSQPITPAPIQSTPPSTFNDSPAPYGNSGARKPADNPVPLPPDRDPGPSMAPAGPGPDSKSSFGSPSGQGTFGEGAQLTIPQRPDVPVQSVATVDPQTFENPIESQRHDRDGLVAVAAKTGPAGPIIKGSDPCDYDRVSYSWLRGIVDLNVRDNSWHIIYSQHPDPHDRYGGAIRLIDSPKLRTLHSGDVVFIEGRIDANHLDSRGKPQYRIEGDQIARIAPGPAMQSMGN